MRRRGFAARLLGPAALLLLAGYFGAVQGQAVTRPRAEAQLVVSGTVVDKASNEGMGYVTVKLRHATTGQLMGGTVTLENGAFRLVLPRFQAAELLLSRLGYLSRIVPLSAPNPPELRLGSIALTAMATELQEVQVVASRPLVEQAADKLLYHADADPERGTLSALELLRKVPQLAVDADDQLYLNGSGSYQVLINGRPSMLLGRDASAALRGLPASLIKTVEVSTTPALRYAADGAGGVINIITQQAQTRGFQCQLDAGASLPVGSTVSSYTSAQTGRLTVSGNATLGQQIQPATRRTSLRDDRVHDTRLAQTGQNEGSSRFRQLSGEAGVELDSLSQLSFSYGFNTNTGRSTSAQLVALTTALGAPLQTYRNITDGRSADQGHDAAVTFRRQFRRPEQLLSLSSRAGWATHASSTDFGVLPLLRFAPQQSTTSLNDHTREHTLQADYVQPLGPLRLELGLLWQQRRTASSYFYQHQEPSTGQFVLDAALSNRFGYREGIGAGYAGLNLQRQRWSWQLGGRLEHTYVAADFEEPGSGISRRYSNLLPSAGISRRLKAASLVRVGYTQRLQRPQVQFLNPYVEMTTPLYVSYGNPALRPAVTHLLTLAYSTLVKNTSFTATLTHHFSASAIERLTTLGADSITRSTFQNVGRQQGYSLAVSANAALGKRLTGNAQTTVSHASFSSRFDGQVQHSTGYMLHSFATLNYRLGRAFRVSGNVGYTSAAVQLQGRNAGYSWHTLTLSQELFKRRTGRITCTLNNPLQPYRTTLQTLSSATFAQQQQSRVLTARVTVALHYGLSRF